MKLKNIFTNMIFIFLSLIFIVFCFKNFYICNKKVWVKINNGVKVHRYIWLRHEKLFYG